MGDYGQILDQSNAARIVGWDLLRRFGCHSGVVIALLLSLVVWNLPPIEPMDIRGMHFLATMVMAVALWVLDVFEDYIVGLTLLFAWVVLDIIPGKVALAGFSENSWFFVVGAFGIAAAIGKTSLPERLANKLLCWIPSYCQKTYRLFLLGVGALTSPLLPSGKARAAVAMPISHAISGAAGFTPRSNGSAAIALSALVGFTQMQFVFLTGADQCLLSWNFLSPSAKAEFGWLSWFLAALPAAVFIFLFMFFAIHLLLPLSRSEMNGVSINFVQPRRVDTACISYNEWIVIATLSLTVLGWLTTSLHGVNEAWVALAALLVFLLSGILDRKAFRTDLDWGLILFFGVLNGFSAITENLHIDAWLMALSGRVLPQFAGEPTKFLLIVFLLVATVRLFLRKTPTAVLFAVTILPFSESVGIHPGVLIVAALMSGECFFLGYQDGPYQIAYAAANGAPFSHTQARKILAAKYIATPLALAVSVPYWKFLGLIR